jgi:PAS domain-containing protein
MRLMQPQQLCATAGGSGDQSVSAEELAAYNEYLKEKSEFVSMRIKDEWQLSGIVATYLLVAMVCPCYHRWLCLAHSAANMCCCHQRATNCCYSTNGCLHMLLHVLLAEATRQAALQDLKRKRKFNPLHTRMKISAAPPGADQQSSQPDAVDVKGSSASSNAAAEVNPAALDLDNQTPAGAEGAAEGQRSPAPDILQQQQQKRQQQQQKQQLLTTIEASSSAAAAGASLPPSPPSPLPPPSSLPRSSSSMLPQEADEDEDFGAILAELLADGSDIPDVEEVSVPVQRQKSTAQLKATAANRRQQQQKQQPGQISAAIAAPRQQSAAEERVSMPTYKGKGRLSNTGTSTSSSSSSGLGAAGNLLQQLTAAMQAEEAAEAAAAADGGGAGREEDEDDLDWEALGQYEQLESYLHQLQKDKAAPRRALAEPAGSKAATGRTPDMRGTAAAAVAGGVLPSAQEALGAVNFKVKKQDPNRTAGPSKTSGSSGGGRLGAGGRSQLDRDLDDMEELVAFLEVMQTSSSSGGGGGSRGSSQQHQGSAAAPAGAGAGQDPGEAALKALLGEDWEAELLDELAAVIDEDADQPQHQHQMVAAADKQQTDPGHGGAADVSAAAAGPASDGAIDGDGDDAPWADDITGLLLGLVTISHEKYLGSPIALPDIEAVGEEGRCRAFYDAPFALFVVDDSMQSSIEYVNAAAERMFGGGYLDLFGQPAHTLVAADLHAQVGLA